MTMIGTAIAVLARHPAELRHRQHDDLLHPVTEVGRQRGDTQGEIAEPVRQLAVHTTLVHMRVPSADVGECDLEADVTLDQLRNLTKALAKLRPRVVCAMLRLVALRVG